MKTWHIQRFWNTLCDLAEPWIFIIVSLIWKWLQSVLDEGRRPGKKSAVSFHCRRMTSLLPEAAVREGRVSCTRPG